MKTLGFTLLLLIADFSYGIGVVVKDNSLFSVHVGTDYQNNEFEKEDSEIASLTGNDWNGNLEASIDGKSSVSAYAYYSNEPDKVSFGMSPFLFQFRNWSDSLSILSQIIFTIDETVNYAISGQHSGKMLNADNQGGIGYAYRSMELFETSNGTDSIIVSESDFAPFGLTAPSGSQSFSSDIDGYRDGWSWKEPITTGSLSGELLPGSYRFTLIHSLNSGTINTDSNGWFELSLGRIKAIPDSNNTMINILLGISVILFLRIFSPISKTL